MVRIREFMKEKTLQTQPGPVAQPYVPPVAATASEPQSRPANADPDPGALYSQLLHECGQSLEAVARGQGVVLNRLPELAESVADLNAEQDEALMERCFDPLAPYSLAQHSVNVAVLLARLGKTMGFGESFVRDLTLLGCLHDVGMVSINDAVSSNQKLDAGQREALQRHPLQSRALLNANRDLPGFIPEIAALEHEREDGSGYPNRLAGKSLNDHGQLLGMADMFEALTHDRPFRARMTASQAFRVILDEHREYFKAELLHGFIRSVPSYPPGTLVALNTDEIARVVRSDAGALFSPVVRLYRVSSRGAELSPYYLNLKEEPRYYVVKELTELP